MPVSAEVQCRNCSAALPDDPPDSGLCPDCADRPVCAECEWPAAVLYPTTSDSDVCEDCCAGYRLCVRCDRYDESTFSLDNDEVVCEGCSTRYEECTNCYTLLAEDHTRCASCGYGTRDDERVHDYFYKPAPRFHGPGPVFLGFELEIKIEPWALDACIDLALDRLGGLGYLKEDSSIGCGFELVTHPMDYAFALERFPWDLLPDLAAHGAYTDRHVGLHVHVSRAGFTSPAHAYRWLKLLYRNESHATTLARRDPDEWASFTTTARSRTARIVKGERGFGRLQAVNAEPEDTFEVRIFASSLHPQQVQAALGFVDATVEYTRTLTAADVARRRGWEWTAFTTWLRARPAYTPLLTELEELACAS
ncbi:amidoligase family protein [Nocardia vaccinii]|uniref:amidoligase family protein n=1 Tax=Nocardia vaccinii TaxID=1822 RepID=UPI000A8D198B|nr:amidoligase family protein [Nocardia vaccinii]